VLLLLRHTTANFFNQQPFWKPQVWEPRETGPGIKAKDHFDALKLVRNDLTGG